MARTICYDKQCVAENRRVTEWKNFSTYIFGAAVIVILVAVALLLVNSTLMMVSPPT